MASVTSAPVGPLLWHRPFLLYFSVRGLSEFAQLIGAVAVGWQVYALSGSAFDLGLVGLAQFVPTALFIFLAGHAADRYDRRWITIICQIASALAAAVMAWGSFAGWLTVPEIFAAVAVWGTATAFDSPAAAALLPGVTPEGLLQRATALATGAQQVATISGPALGGAIYALAPGAPYTAMTLFWLVAALLSIGIRVPRPAAADERPSFAALFDGVGFVRRNPALLGAISLDLFAVLLGGATALLPIYAHDILHTGPWGLGALRAAPAVGALLMATLLAHRAIERRVGLRMFQAVIVFGIATVGFALSHSLWVSLAALAVMGAADTVSMVIRIALVQLTTPDAMRGRVGAVNFLFVNTSYQLGEFESGITAALFGAMPAAVIGGIGTIIVAFLWMGLFPALRDAERLE
jgi:MFS family permease